MIGFVPVCPKFRPPHVGIVNCYCIDAAESRYILSQTRSSAIAQEIRQLKSCQLLHNCTKKNPIWKGLQCVSDREGHKVVGIAAIRLGHISLPISVL